MKKVIVITGPTATGKTKLAIEKAIAENGELVNADSRQIYKKLDIITNKDLTNHNFHIARKEGTFDVGYYTFDAPTREKIIIWLYDIVDAKDHFSSFDFQSLAVSQIKDILKRGKTPIVIGGTYFYLYHLLYTVDTQTVPPDWELRTRLDAMTVKEKQRMLQELDPEVFVKMNESDRNNPRRLMRRIEVLTHNTKEDMKGFNTSYVMSLSQKLGEEVEIEYIGLRYGNKERLNEIIDKKVDERVEKGAIEEVAKLLEEGYIPTDPGMKTNGYQQIIPYIQEKITKEKAIETWKIREHQYAKKQYTFMKKDPHIGWRDI
jgi:tRNA dimethylallyltransferase